MRPLADLLRGVEGAHLVRGDGGTLVGGVSNDTRRLAPGDLYVAVPGSSFDGLELVPEAVAQGASAIVAERPPPADPGLPLVLVPSARAALADLACAYHGHPSRHIPVVGITGTDGKTSTTHLLSAILEARGLRTGWLTTVNTKVGGDLRPNAAEHTTPEAPLVQATLAEMVAAGLDVAIVETSSHALALDRVRGVRYRVGVFTNLSPEHLNFHGTFEAYRDAKASLFERLPADGLAVLNADDPRHRYMAARTHARPFTFGVENRAADVYATDVRLGPSGTTFRLHLAAPRQPRAAGPVARAAPLPPPEGTSPRSWGAGAGDAGRTCSPASCLQEVALATRLVGRFNVANWLAAYGAATAFGATVEDLERAVMRQAPVPGRMNLVEQGQPFPVLVDFAHTPQALEKALETVRGLVPGRVLLVFGLAGGRDVHNRPIMGALAARLADYVAITQDDPYDEDPWQIARQIAAGALQAGAREGERFTVDLDRRSAIRDVLRRARAGDAVLLAGKGHEQRMMTRHGREPWNDAQVAGEELRRLGFGEPPPRPPGPSESPGGPA